MKDREKIRTTPHLRFASSSSLASSPCLAGVEVNGGQRAQLASGSGSVRVVWHTVSHVGHFGKGGREVVKPVGVAVGELARSVAGGGHHRLVRRAAEVTVGSSEGTTHLIGSASEVLHIKIVGQSHVCVQHDGVLAGGVTLPLSAVLSRIQNVVPILKEKIRQHNLSRNAENTYEGEQLAVEQIVKDVRSGVPSVNQSVRGGVISRHSEAGVFLVHMAQGVSTNQSS